MFNNHRTSQVFILIIDIISICCLIVCTVLNILLLATIDFHSDNIVDIKENFESVPFIDLSILPEGQSQCENGKELLIIDKWKGTVKGCDCNYRSDMSYIQYEEKMHRKYCEKKKQTEKSCSNIEPVKSIDITKWKNKAFCYPKLDGNYTYYSLLLNSVKEGENCPIGFKACGYLDNLNNIMCIQNDKTCPINFIVVTTNSAPPTQYGSYTYNTINLDDGTYMHYTNEATDKHVLSKFKLSEGDVCLDLDEYNSNGIHYILDHYEYFGCKNKVDGKLYDERYTKLDQMIKYWLYYDNKIVDKMNKLRMYPFDTLKQENIMLYQRGYLGFNLECLLNDDFKPDNLKNFKHNSDVSKYLNIASIFLIGANLLINLVNLIRKYQKKFDMKCNWTYALLGMAAFVLSLSSFCMTVQIKNIGTKCGDNYSSYLMEEAQNDLDKNEKYTIVIFCLSFVTMIGYFLDDIFLCCFDCNSNKESSVNNRGNNAIQSDEKEVIQKDDNEVGSINPQIVNVANDKAY